MRHCYTLESDPEMQLPEAAPDRTPKIPELQR